MTTLRSLPLMPTPLSALVRHLPRQGGEGGDAPDARPAARATERRCPGVLMPGDTVRALAIPQRAAAPRPRHVDLTMSLIEVITSVRMPNPAWRVMADLTAPGKDPGTLSAGQARRAMALLRSKLGEAGVLLSNDDVTLALIQPDRPARLRQPYMLGLRRRLGMQRLIVALRALLPVTIEQRLTNRALAGAIRRPRVSLRDIVVAARCVGGGGGVRVAHRESSRRLEGAAPAHLCTQGSIIAKVA